tara:strand:- start:1398 stop:1745 length:348 start_codon:yes stop_codon:yes gene_type:complete
MHTFSDEPSGRFYSDGEGSGEEFREEFLRVQLSKLEENQKLKIIIDDEIEGYGSSFLVEGFAGMVKYGYMQADELLNKIDIDFTETDFQFYADKITQYINEAQFNSQVYTPTEKL